MGEEENFYFSVGSENIIIFQVFKKESYLRTAVKCGEVVWSRGILKKGYGLCHGVSGNAYTFISLYQHTNDLKYLYRACKFAELCMRQAKDYDRIPDRPFSLFEGNLQLNTITKCPE